MYLYVGHLVFRHPGIEFRGPTHPLDENFIFTASFPFSYDLFYTPRGIRFLVDLLNFSFVKRTGYGFFGKVF